MKAESLIKYVKHWKGILCNQNSLWVLKKAIENIKLKLRTKGSSMSSEKYSKIIFLIAQYNQKKYDAWYHKRKRAKSHLISRSAGQKKKY